MAARVDVPYRMRPRERLEFGFDVSTEIATTDVVSSVAWDVSSDDAALGVTVTAIGSTVDANKVAWAWVEVATAQQGGAQWNGNGTVVWPRVRVTINGLRVVEGRLPIVIRNE